MPKRAPRRRWLRPLRWLGFLLGGWVLAGILAVLALRFVPPPVSAVMAWDWIDARTAGERGFSVDYRWTPWDEVSPAVPIALVAAEDQKFPFHHGFDVESIQDALAAADDGARLRGASTISQQVAKNLFLWKGRSFVRKGLEAYFTVLIEALWPKRRILEVYLNIAEFGPGIYGVGAASERFFHVSPARLDARQAALLAAVLPNPARLHAERPSRYVLERAQWIERQARQLGGAAYLPE
ncbi:MAG: monofunctional biosynthetic peptidoglycan transglycosylase [Xanthomonadales bacterium]|nr:monofunctional biosynthetic peptidoglycan transglycosylase [Xanthomonadales bacterium]